MTGTDPRGEAGENGLGRRPPSLSAKERELRRGGWSPIDRLSPPDVWLHDLYDNLMYRWLVKDVVMRNDEHGIELRYRGRRKEDRICGARTMRPGIPGFTGYSWRMDQSVPHEVVCTIIGEHRDTPHVGVPADCADMTCKCAAYGCAHLVITNIVIGRDPALSASTEGSDE